MRNRSSTGWLFGLVGSALAHVGLLLGLFVLGRDAAAGADDGTAELAVMAATPIDLVADVGVDDRTAPPVASQPIAAQRPWDAPPGDKDNPVPVTVAPADADGRARLAPAPDQGLSGGTPRDHAFRRDRTVLRSRLSDGATEAQPARTRTSGRQSSPQAQRREPVVGVGDSVRTVVPQRPPATGRTPTELALGGTPAGAAPEVSPASEAEPITARTQGPIDAERGARAFDNEQPGKANDNDTLRAASDEMHPGLTDFSRSAAPAPERSPEGRGPGAQPGAVARPSPGTAAAQLGAPNPKLTAQEVAERTLERHYQRYKQELKRRVEGVLDFPKALALRLEQGETIVYFVVGVEGRLSEGPWVVKSSGFQEFDSAALRAVRRAAPFPPMPDGGNARPLPVSMPVTFDNPVVR
jgi:TonB family protein